MGIYCSVDMGLCFCLEFFTLLNFIDNIMIFSNLLYDRFSINLYARICRMEITNLYS